MLVDILHEPWTGLVERTMASLSVLVVQFVLDYAVSITLISIRYLCKANWLFSGSVNFEIKHVQSLVTSYNVMILFTLDAVIEVHIGV